VATRTDATQDFGPAVGLTSLNSSANENGPSISANGLQLYFHSDRNGPRVLFVAERDSIDEEFTSATPIAIALNNAGLPDIAADDRALYFSSDDAGGMGDLDLWVVEREEPTMPWSAPAPLQLVNSASNDTSPSIDPAGTTLYFQSGRDDPSTDVFVATRPDTLAPFSNATQESVASVLGVGEYDPDISYDTTALALSLNIASGLGMTDIWLSTRDCPSAN
jgi:Tol biopolymer transport system component